MNSVKTIDSHVHVGKGILKDPLQSGVDAQTLLKVTNESGLEKSIVFAHWHKGYKKANEEVYSDFVQKYPDRFVMYIRFRPVPKRKRRILKKEEYDSEEDLKEYLERFKPKGFKVHLMMDGVPTDEMFRIIEDSGLPLLIHGGTSAPTSMIEKKIILKYNIPLIIAHCGGFPLDINLYKQTIDLVKKYPNVYTDTAFVHIRYILKDLITSCPDKVFFGSDFPAQHPMAGIMNIKTLDISDDLKINVLGKNISELLKL
jgi:predicted TIM-barrel fold metal-dependent hydrolase